LHEFSIASSIVETILDLASRHNANRVVEVHLRIGMLRALCPEQLKFSYDILAKGTILEGSKLLIEESTGSVRCGRCDCSSVLGQDTGTFHFGAPLLLCPQCGGTVMIEGGDECTITRVRMSMPDEKDENMMA